MKVDSRMIAGDGLPITREPRMGTVLQVGAESRRLTSSLLVAAVVACFLGGCATPGPGPQSDADPYGDPADSAVVQPCTEPAWFRYDASGRPWAEGAVDGQLIGLGRGATAEQARQRAMQDILTQGLVDVRTRCRDRRGTVWGVGGSERQAEAGGHDLEWGKGSQDGRALDYREQSECETRLHAELRQRQFETLAPPQSCAGQVWVKLGLDVRSLRDRVRALLRDAPVRHPGPTYCSGVTPLTTAPLCRWLTQTLPGRGAVAVELRRQGVAWEYGLDGAFLRLDEADLGDVLVWESQSQCRSWFAPWRDGRVVERLRAGENLTLAILPPEDPRGFYSVLNVHEDGRTQLLLANQPLPEPRRHDLNASLEPGATRSLDVLVGLRHAQTLDWSRFPLVEREIVGGDGRDGLPLLLERMGGASQATLCIQTVRVDAP